MSDISERSNLSEMSDLNWPTTPLQVSTVDLDVEYFEFGNPDGVPLVLVHGFPDAPVGWRAVIAELDRQRHRIVVPYLRGFGGTHVRHEDKVAGQPAALAHDLVSLLDALHVQQAHFVGHDWGSTTVNSAAVIAPERFLSLTTLASPYLLWHGNLLPPQQVRAFWYQFYFQLDVAREMLAKHAAAFCKELWRAWSPTWQFSAREFDGTAAAWHNPQFVAIVIHYYRMRWQNASSAAAYAQLQRRLEMQPKPAIAVPALHIQGLDDACVLPAAVDGQERCFSRGYERLDMAGCGHFPHREKPREVAAAISRHVAATCV